MPEDVHVAGLRLETHQHATNPRNTEMRTPEMLARALSRARENSQNKENLVPEKPGSGRGRRRMVVSTSRSPLPSDYPRAPLQDITACMHALQLSTSWIRTRMQTHRIIPPRQSITHDSPAQERSAQEGPLQVAQTTMSIIPSPVPEQEIRGAVTREETDVQTHGSPVQERSVQEGPLQVAQTTMSIIPSPVPEQEIRGAVTREETDVQILGPGMPLMYQTRVDIHSPSTVDTVPGLHQDNQVQDISTRDDSRLAERTFARFFGTALQSGSQNEISGRDRNGSCPQQKKTSSSKNTAKTLMKMR